jgi:hypothetical protein
MNFSTNSSDVDVTVSRLHLSVVSHWLYVIAPIMVHSSIYCMSSCSTSSSGHCVQLFIRQSSVGELQLISASRCFSVDIFLSRLISLVSSLSWTALAMSLTFWCWTHTQTDWVPAAPTRITYLDQSWQNLEKPILTSGKSFLSVWTISFRLPSSSFFGHESIYHPFSMT